MFNWLHVLSALISIPDRLVRVGALRLHQRSIIFQSCVTVVKSNMSFVPLPLALVVTYLSNKSVRKVKYIYKGLKIFFQVEPCTSWQRIWEQGKAFVLPSSVCCSICAAASGCKRGSCISHGDWERRWEIRCFRL